MAEKAKKQTTKKKGYGMKSISAKLLTILVPIVAVFIVGLTLFVAFQARSVIISRAKSELHQESRANANEISGNTTQRSHRHLKAHPIRITMKFLKDSSIPSITSRRLLPGSISVLTIRNISTAPAGFRMRATIPPAVPGIQ